MTDEDNMMMENKDNKSSNRRSTKFMKEPKEVLGFAFDNSVTKAAIFYFSKLPFIEKKTRINKMCARFYGMMLVFCSVVIVTLQLFLMQYQWTRIMDDGSYRFLHGTDYLLYAKPG